jgi:hypothetical protein
MVATEINLAHGIARRAIKAFAGQDIVRVAAILRFLDRTLRTLVPVAE